MTLYISKKANLKINVGIDRDSAIRILLLVITVLILIGLALAIACICINSQLVRIYTEAGEYLSPADILGDGTRFGADYDPDCVNRAGVYYFTAIKDGEAYNVRLSVMDTKAPQVTLKDVYFAVNQDGEGEVFYPDPLDFIESFYEPNGLKGEFLTPMPEMKRLGEYPMQVQYSDASGNKTEVFDVKMIQITDTEPPEIDASPLIVCEVGGTIAYKPYVTLTDNCVGELGLKVDESKLDLSTVGDYTVYVTARDRVGNESEAVAIKVSVVEAYDEKVLDELLDEIVEDIAPEGKTREQICREIYKTVRRELVYTGDSQKGDVKRAAYHALVGGGGDCYSYFALSKLLFERCGIENLDLERISGVGEGEHFWSLVNIGDSDNPMWYHFDATELRVDRYDHSGCLLTDKQIWAYSKARDGFYRYDKNGLPSTAEKIITPTATLEPLY